MEKDKTVEDVSIECPCCEKMISTVDVHECAETLQTGVLDIDGLDMDAPETPDFKYSCPKCGHALYNGRQLETWQELREEV